MSDETEHIQLTLSATAKGFDILAITSGIGNGWNFPADTLKASLSKWQNVPVYIDHEGTGDKSRHSARDLAGKLSAPQWDDTTQGIRAQVIPSGPSASVLSALAEAALQDPTLPIGFSADLTFSATGKQVSEIKRVLSTDAVLHPARGGKFLRALMSQLSKGDVPMPEETTQAQTNEQERAALSELLDVKADKQAAAAEYEQIRALRLQACSDLLETSLTASKLPAPVAKRVREQFQGKIFTAEELKKAIDDNRAMLSELADGTQINGPARITNVHASDDQIRAAVDDLFGNERDEALKNVKAAKLSGIRELYLLMTGDNELRGGVEEARASFQLKTTNFPVVVKNALNKSLQRQWDMLGKEGYNWWEKIATVESFSSVNDITWSIFGTVASLPTVGEGEEYPTLKIGDGGETSSFTKYGGYIGLTLEAIDRDDTRALRAIPRELANAALRNISSLVAAIFTSNSAVGPTLADTGALFNATAVTTKGGHANLLTTALGTDYTAWDAIATAMYNQPMLVANETSYYGAGKKVAVNPKYCLVPRALAAQAYALFAPRWDSVVQSVPTKGGNFYMGQVEPVVVPEWTDATDFAAVTSPSIMPGVMIGTRFGIRPEIFIAGSETDPAMFMNDESRMKVRHFLAVGVADFRPLHKSNVAG